MARKVQVLLVDDLDGTDLGTNGETVSFGMGGERYEIDLSKPNAEKFRTMLGEYVQAARNVTRQPGGGGSRRHTTTRSASDRDETKQARSWLVEQGYLTNESRGRISAENWERYRNKTPNPNRPMLPGTAPSLAETKAEVPAKKPEQPKAEQPKKAAASTAPESRGNSTTPAKASAGTKTPEKATA